MRIEVLETVEEVARRAADIVCAQAGGTLALASGETPAGLYAELARRIATAEADLSGVTAFAVDELHGVSPEHPATNASYFARHLRGVPLRALHIMDASAAQPEAECARFAALIAETGGLDLALLGIGRNGHLAFNEPGSPTDSRCRAVSLAPSTRESYATAFGSLDATPSRGLTLGLADLLAARAVLLLATGGEKAEVIAQAIEGPVAEALPASALQRHANATVLLDRQAAAQLQA